MHVAFLQESNIKKVKDTAYADAKSLKDVVSLQVCVCVFVCMYVRIYVSKSHIETCITDIICLLAYFNTCLDTHTHTDTYQSNRHIHTQVTLLKLLINLLTIKSTRRSRNAH